MNEFSNDKSRRAKQFHSTHWSLVLAASEDSDAALEELCQIYWPPLHWHLRRMGYEEVEADDLTQAFFARLLEKRLLGFADQKRGRFRTFLLTALRRFVINEWQRDESIKRGGGRKRIDLTDRESAAFDAPGGDLSADRQFDRQWALVVLQRSFEELAREAVESGNREQFEALAPLMTRDRENESYDELASRLSTSPGALRMSVSRMRSRLRELVRAEIRKTVESDAEVDDEVRLLFVALRN